MVSAAVAVTVEVRARHNWALLLVAGLGVQGDRKSGVVRSACKVVGRRPI